MSIAELQDSPEPQGPPPDPNVVLADDFRLRSLIICLTGPEGAGKSVLAKGLASRELAEVNPELHHFGFNTINCIHFRQVLAWHGYKEQEEPYDMAVYHQGLQEKGEGHAVLNRILNLPHGLHVIDAIHHPDDLEYLKSFGAVGLALTASLTTCREQYAADQSDEKHLSVQRRFMKALAAAGLEAGKMRGTADQAMLRREVERHYDRFMDVDHHEEIARCLDLADYTIKADHYVPPRQAVEEDIIKGFAVAEGHIEVREQRAIADEALEFIVNQALPQWAVENLWPM